MRTPIGILIFLMMISCNHNAQEKHTNALIHETSPYLLQHAHNPVNWYAWNDETLAKAQQENKLLIISIGYAACHWCHVMEHECFENEEVAKVMNDNFISIKVDREERPDVDAVYMEALQAMSGRGGWPLNMIALPNGKPVWGATYVPKEGWINALNQLVKLYKDDTENMEQFADKLTKALQANPSSTSIPKEQFQKQNFDSLLKTWSASFDIQKGGYNRAPKFPMPNNYAFLLRYAFQKKDEQLLYYVNTTLKAMATGGLFDQVGGGFARYSTDVNWHIPHFEKMLYDNAQLVSLYANAYKVNQNSLYKELIKRTLNFVDKELKHPKGYFYSSLDADSKNELGELEEGAYYVWTKEELQKLITKDFDIFSKYYRLEESLWEDGKYHLQRTKDSIQGISKAGMEKRVVAWRKVLNGYRSKRKRPRLDDKMLTSWNALMIKGYVDAYEALGKKAYLEQAQKSMSWLLKQQKKEDGGLYRNYKERRSTINAFLIDYATTIEALIALYQTDFDENWLEEAKKLTEYTLVNFYDKNQDLFYFKSNKDKQLIARKSPISDNVISSGNSIMANNLFLLGQLFLEISYQEISQQMLSKVQGDFETYPSGYVNWLNLQMNFSFPFYELAIVGKDSESKQKDFLSDYIPNVIIAGSKKESNLKLLQYKYKKGKTWLYVCEQGNCLLPVEDVEKAKQQLDK